MKLPHYDFIITTDRSMMTNHHGKEFLGFVTTGPIFISFGPFKKLSEKFHTYISAPKMKTDKYGRPWQAPYGLRKIEAALVDAGFKAAIIDPDHVHKYLRNAKALLIGHHDYFGLNPPSSTWAVIVGKEPLNAYLFRKFMIKLRPLVMECKVKNNLKVIVGGPAAWQWMYFPELIEYFGVDTVFMGEGEKHVVELAEKIMSSEPLPRYIYVSAKDAPDLNEIPSIKYPSVNGLVELGRGCPRNCAFCPVNALIRPVRWYSLDKIEEELKVNVRHGVVHGLIHAEDVPLYGSTSVYPKPEKLLKLHELVKKYYKTVSWSHATLAAVLLCEKKGKLMTKLSEIITSDEQSWWGAQIGLETGSRRLAKIIMPAKAAPFKIEDWWEVVEESLAIMHDVKLIPALTLIVGLPGEESSDVVETIELIERLKPYRSLIVPMFYVPMSHIKADKTGWIVKYNLIPEHIELLRVIFKHSIYWARDIVNHFYLSNPIYLPLRLALNYFINYVERKVKEIEGKLEQIIENLKTRKFEKKVEASELIKALSEVKCSV